MLACVHERACRGRGGTGPGHSAVAGALASMKKRPSNKFNICVAWVLGFVTRQKLSQGHSVKDMRALQQVKVQLFTGAAVAQAAGHLPHAQQPNSMTLNQ